MSERDPQEEALFEAARRLTDAVQRAAFLDLACAGNPVLRKRLDELLGAQGAADDFFRPLPQPRAVPVPPVVSEPTPDEQIGTMIGRYKLLQKIGEGGFGVVYLAEQKEPVKRRVALKIIKLGMDTKQVVARFEAERQALALMDHPNIARIYDGGMTGAAESQSSNLQSPIRNPQSEIPSGLPYFVMELVRGIPITQYCDENQLSTDERLELFLQVCHAVQHAHQKGVIHRDLKPSNILVTINDGQAVPKVIDFGVAKATQQELTDKTIVTQFHHFIGTPAYMSPEQAAITSLDIDTRSDIYALGVLLYELLTGKTPFDGRELLASGLDDMRRTIREKEPPRPSTRLSTMAEGDRTTVARQRKSEAPKLIHQLRGDLDWIVMKCLEKDRNRRYETASGLAMDLTRHLSNEPVVARPPSAAYRFHKLLRRNKLAVAASGAVLTALLTGLSVSLWLLARETVARERAVAAEREQGRLREQAEHAEQAKTEQLWAAQFASARATRQTHAKGHRFESLVAVSNAAVIRPSVALRNEAIAALALADLGPAQFGQDTPWSGDRPVELAQAFDSDLRRIALLTQDGTISLRRASDHAELLRIPPGTHRIRNARLKFSPDDRYLAARDVNGQFCVWQLEPLQLRVEKLLHPGPPYSLEFSADSRQVAVGEQNSRLSFFSLSESVSPPTPAREPDSALELSMEATEIAFDSTNTRLAVSGGNQVQVWNWPRRELHASISEPMTPATLLWHSDARHLIVGTETGEIHVWDTLLGKCQTLKGHSTFVSALALHPRADLFVSHSWDRTTKLWDVALDAPLLSTDEGFALQFSRDRTRLGFRHDTKRYGVWSVANSRVFRAVSSGANGLHSLDFAPDGRTLLAAGDATLLWLNLSTGSVSRRAMPGLTHARFNAEGTAVLVGTTNGLERWPLSRVSTFALAGIPLAGGGEPIGTNRFPLSYRMGMPADRRVVLVFEQWLAPGHLQALLSDERGVGRAFRSPIQAPLANAAISLDGRWLALSHAKGPVIVLDTETGDVVKKWPELQSASAEFTPDGRWLVTNSGQEFQFWEVGTWQPGLRLASENAGLTAGVMAFAREGRLMAILRGPSTIELFDWQKGEMIGQLLPPQPQPIHTFTFSPDGSVLAAVGKAALHLWDLREVRRELVALNLDWNLPPYPPGTNSLGDLVFRHLKNENE